MKKYTACFVCTLFIVFTGYLQAAVNSDKLIGLLIKKGQITQEEALELKSEAEDIALRPVKITGYSQVLYKHDQAQGTYDSFSVRRARLEIKGSFVDNYDYDFHAEFGKGSVKLLDAAIGYKYNNYLKITMGQFKLPLSQENLSSDSKPDFIDRPQVVDALVARGKDISGDQNGRDIGMQLSGSCIQNKVEYAAGVFNGSGINTSSDNNNRKDISGRAVCHFTKVFSIGCSYYTGSYGVHEENRIRSGGEFSYSGDIIMVKGEYIRGTDGIAGSNIVKEGSYLLAGYYIVPSKVQLTARCDVYDPNTDISNDVSTINTYGINCFLTKWMTAQINYEQKINKDDTFQAQFTLQF